MKKRMGLVLRGISTGVIIGLLISFVISWQVGLGIYYPGPPNYMEKFDTELAAFGWALVLWGMVSLLFTLTAFVYRKDDWSLTKQTIIHFILTYLGLLTLNTLLVWVDYSVKGVLVFSLIFVVIYLINWTASMLKIKMNLKDINKKLEKGGQ